MEYHNYVDEVSLSLEYEATLVEEFTNSFSLYHIYLYEFIGTNKIITHDAVTARYDDYTISVTQEFSRELHERALLRLAGIAVDRLRRTEEQCTVLLVRELPGEELRAINEFVSRPSKH